MIGNQNLFLSSVIVLLFLLAATNYAYPQTIADNISWKITFIADKSNCNFAEDNKIKEIEGIVTKYFDLYKLENHLLGTDCLSSEKYFDNSVANDADLNILVFDENVGNKLMIKYGYEGLYAHFGDERMHNHVIMVATHPQYSSAYENTEFSWSLSHELSHFILSYKGHNVESIERLLHADKPNYSDCVGNISEKCNEIKTTIISNVSGKKLNVMSPLKEIVDQNSMTYLSDDLYSSYAVKKLLHGITGWWMNGIIDDEFYLNALKQIVDVPASKNDTVNFSQIPMSNGFSILDEVKNSDIGVNSFKTKINDIFRYVPFDTHSIISKSESSKIPSWFKNRAMLWQDVKMGDRTFLDGIDVLARNGLLQEK